ncbi:hypothetical protein SAMN04489724_1082 [Algoriphagus locisalis]|uniref:Uncharacterized protein n=1 Tax=Algoriphagus locisalis TaxID=305507 RepID=A0A1I6YL95_9BACT|nr:hypothetical protein [Algoriphagus locisalis]SFT51250.1 hypothetical protein SAMN04489724_1082 [Algoriphagus locisalis]
MDIIELIERRNLDELGRRFLEESIDYALIKDFGKSYLCAKKGLEIITCDCVSHGWKKNYDNSDKHLFDELIINYQNPEEYYFVKAFILSYEEELTSLYLALDSINKYSSLKKNSTGEYVRSRILSKLQKHKEAFEILWSLSISDETSKTFYRMGRLEEEHLNQNGLENLFHAFQRNPTSSCCLRNIKKYTLARDVKFHDNNGSVLMKYFMKSEDEWKFQEVYESYLFDQRNSKKHPYNNENTLKEIEMFTEEMFKISSNYLDEINGTQSNDNNINVNYDDLDLRYPKSSHNDYYNDSLDLDQQDPEFYDNL